MELNKEFVKKVSVAINSTWSAIAYDLAECYQESGEELDSEGAMEAVLDANRIQIYGGEGAKEVEDLISEAIKEHGYDEVLKFLADEFNLGI